MYSFHAAVQNFTLRDALGSDLSGTLKSLHDMGMRYCETAGLYGLSPAEARDLFDKNGLQAIGAHYGLDHLEVSFDAVVHEAQAMGFDFVVLPWIGQDIYGGGWAQVADRLNRLGKRYRQEGLELLYHNHSFEFDLENGKPGYDILMEGAEAFGFELDVYWCFAAGFDPVDYVRRLSGRLPLAHFKDGIPGNKPEHVPCGQGKIDWSPLLDACEEAGVKYGIIELDESPIDPIEAVRQSLEFFVSRGVPA